ncbi:MAG: hypothetical protein GXD23_07210 [Comamonadaceae bacterium]|uniref:hypothetical protein n=1 Tax=Hydrogenophaga sp. SNF1 TaxID=3098762 RepID=UPI002ACC164D|nr:hypothetical protein [Hydrogenophaga sp. SNF1]NCT97140.1 hypothetical protein [Comamonadaceae bacterium]WQB82686.1 hypothetical protein SOM08_17050 [Hydrogenophaga sp. SNF1]
MEPLPPHPIPGRRQLLALGAATGAAALMAGCSVWPSLPVPGRQAPAADPAYRRTAASHLYRRYPQRIYPGKLPPMLYAIGVLEVVVEGNGRVGSFKWLRSPTHAPEVVAQIERLVRDAAPFPSPGSRTSYIDTWLWDRSGRFQLDTLSEGQLQG